MTAQRSYKSPSDAIEAWLMEFKPKTRRQTIQHTDRDSIEEALNSIGTKKDYMIINSLGSSALWRYENKMVGAWQENYEIYIKDAAENARTNIEEFFRTVFNYHQIKPFSWKKMAAIDIEDLENKVFKLTIEVT